MNEARINQVVKFWQRITGRQPPKKIGFASVRYPYAGGFLSGGEIKLHPWAAEDAVFHELAHLEQWQDGRLSFSEEGVWFFEGSPVFALSYEERPAEIEAFAATTKYLHLFSLEEPDLFYNGGAEKDWDTPS